MKVEFRRAELPRELAGLAAFDRKVFPPGDVFPREYWRACESWWLLLNGRKVGCCAFELDAGYRDDGLRREGSLYISTTGILPAYRGQGLGALFKAWQLAYAKRHGYARVLTTTRVGNTAMIRLNRRFGFRTRKRLPAYYSEPVDDALVMEWRASAESVVSSQLSRKRAPKAR